MAELHPLLTQSVGFRPCQDADHKIVARSFIPPSGITHLSQKAGGRGRALARVCQAVRPIRVRSSTTVFGKSAQMSPFGGSLACSRTLVGCPELAIMRSMN
jgi:hypothetical protein